jgi:uncharacterized protein
MNARSGPARAGLIGVLLWLLAAIAAAQEVLPVPPLTARVIDQTATLSPAQREALEAKLAAFEAEAGPQIVVLVVPTTAPEDIAAYAWRVADTWKIGRRDVGDGLLLIVAKNDRAVRIEVARALEGAVPDLAARQIIDRAIVPAFRAGDFAGGLSAALDQLIAHIKGEHLPPPERRAAEPRGVNLEALAIFFFVGVPVVGAVLTGIFGRKLGSLLTGGVAGGVGWIVTASVLAAVAAGLLALLLVGVVGVGSAVRGGRRGGWPPMGPPGGFGGGRGGGFGGGGGFGSGGGGSFGGGGASGRW